jgi:hypothetical protein
MVSTHQVQNGVFRFELTPNEFPPRTSDMCENMSSMETISINYGGRKSLYDVEYLCLLGALKVIITPHSGKCTRIEEINISKSLIFLVFLFRY